jgi:hypothetical protein
MSPAKVLDIHVGGSINVHGHLDADGTTDHVCNVMTLTAETCEKIFNSKRNLRATGRV